KLDPRLVWKSLRSFAQQRRIIPTPRRRQKALRTALVQGEVSLNRFPCEFACEDVQLIARRYSGWRYLVWNQHSGGRHARSAERFAQRLNVDIITRGVGWPPA